MVKRVNVEEIVKELERKNPKSIYEKFIENGLKKTSISSALHWFAETVSNLYPKELPILRDTIKGMRSGSWVKPNDSERERKLQGFTIVLNKMLGDKK